MLDTNRDDEDDDDDDDDQGEGEQKAEWAFDVEEERYSDEVVFPSHHATPDSVEFNAGFVEIVRCMLAEWKKTWN